MHWHADQGIHEADADLAIPAAGGHLTVVIRRYSDPALPASSTTEMLCSFDEDQPLGGIEAVATPIMRPSDALDEKSLSAVVVEISKTTYLIGLLRGAETLKDIALLHRAAWFVLPIRLDGGRAAEIAFELDPEGHRALDALFGQHTTP